KNVTYRITITNKGIANASNISINDVLPSGWTFQGITSNTCNIQTATSTGSGTINFVNGGIGKASNSYTPASCSFEFNALVPENQSDGTYYNKFNASYADKDNTIYTLSGSDTGTSVGLLIGEPKLLITKEAHPQVVYREDTINFTITVKNIGVKTAYNVSISDILPDGFSLISGNLSYFINTLSPNESKIYTVSVKVEDAPLGTAINRVAAVAHKENMSGEEIFADNFAIVTINKKEILVNAPNIVVSKIPSSNSTTKGETINFTIIVRNTGNATAYNISVKDVLPVGFVNLTQSEFLINNLSTNEVINFTVNVNVTDDSYYGKVFNVVSVSYEFNGTNFTVANSTNVDVVTPSILCYPKLKIWKSVCEYDDASNQIQQCYSEEEAKNIIFNKSQGVCFHIYVANIAKNISCAASIFNVTVYDTLPEGHNVLSNYGNLILNYTPNELPASASFGYYICANITENASSGENINIIHTRGYYYDEISKTFKETYDEGVAKYFIESKPEYPVLNVTKTSTVSNITQGDEVEYIINVSNVGNSTAYNVLFNDTLSGGFEFINVTGVMYYNASSGTSYPVNYGVVNYSDYAAGTTILEILVGNISVNDRVIIKFNTLTEDTIQATFLRANIVTVTGHYLNTSGEKVVGSDDCWININRKEELYPRFEVNKTASQSVATIGDYLNFAVNISNVGPGKAYNISITDVIPSEFEFVSSSSDNITYVNTTRTLITNISQLSTNENFIFTYIVRVISVPQSNKSVVNTVSVTGHAINGSGEMISGTDSETVTLIKAEGLNLTVTKTCNSKVAKGEIAECNIKVTNTGPSTAFNVTITDTPPNKFTNLTVLNYSYNSIFVGETKEIIVKFDTTGANTGMVTNYVDVKAKDSANDTYKFTGTANVEIYEEIAGGCCGIDVVKISNASNIITQPGDKVAYSIIVRNLKGVNMTINISDVPPYGMSCTNISFNNVFMYPKQEISFNVNCTVTSNVSTGANVNEVYVTGVDGNGNTFNRQATATITVSKPDISIVKKSLTTPVIPGKNVTYRIAIINKGIANASNIAITDTLP
ncbi:MAG: hypothetical protein CVT88_07350, partial [Candidatus Altiarchaeales archaeon HGW-Altiarchaeales-1]